MYHAGIMAYHMLITSQFIPQQGEDALETQEWVVIEVAGAERRGYLLREFKAHVLGLGLLAENGGPTGYRSAIPLEAEPRHPGNVAIAKSPARPPQPKSSRSALITSSERHQRALAFLWNARTTCEGHSALRYRSR